MILEIAHRTRYRYAHQAAFSQHLLRLTPRNGASQRVLETEIRIEPSPDHVEHHDDMFGNTQHVATAQSVVATRTDSDRSPLFDDDEDMAEKLLKADIMKHVARGGRLW